MTFGTESANYLSFYLMGFEPATVHLAQHKSLIRIRSHQKYSVEKKLFSFFILLLLEPFFADAVAVVDVIVVAVVVVVAFDNKSLKLGKD